MHNSPTHLAQPKTRWDVKKYRVWILWLLFAGVALVTLALVGSLAGYQSAWQQHRQRQSTAAAAAVQEQYNLAQEDLQTGRYDLARQRFEYVLAHDPSFPGAADGLAQAMSILFATATPSPLPPTVTPTPTRDLRPIEDLMTQAQNQFVEGNWAGVIDTLIALRKEDALYRVVDADSLLYRSLRNRGLDKIRMEANLEGGIYDLALAEGFGPLDVEAYNWRNLARLYVIGSSFWEVYPEQAVNYFGQLAAAAPGLRDASGWTAGERYRVSLLHLGDKLARAGEWCAAQEQYELALSMRDESGAQATAVHAAWMCAPPTSTATVSPMPTDTPTITPTGTFLPPTPGDTATATLAPPSPTTGAGATPSSTPTPTNTQAPPVDATMTPTATVEAPPTPTATVEAPPTPTETLPPDIVPETPTPTGVINP